MKKFLLALALVTTLAVSPMGVSIASAQQGCYGPPRHHHNHHQSYRPPYYGGGGGYGGYGGYGYSGYAPAPIYNYRPGYGSGYGPYGSGQLGIYGSRGGLSIGW